MGARPSHTGNVSGTQTPCPAGKNHSTATGKGSRGLESGSGIPGWVWADALAEGLIPEEEAPNETTVKHRKNSIGLKLKSIIRLSSRKRQEIVQPAPSPEQGNSETAELANPVSLVEAAAKATKGKNQVGSISTFGSTRPPVEVPKRSSSLGKCSVGPGARSKLDSIPVGNSENATHPLAALPQAEPVVDVPLEEHSIRHQISTRRARAKIAAGTPTCASPAGISVPPISNPYLPYTMEREPGVTSYSAVSANTTYTAHGSSVATDPGSVECSSAPIKLSKISPRKELGQNQTNGHNSKTLIAPRDRAGYRYTSCQEIPDPDFSATERHKQHRKKRSSKEKTDKERGAKVKEKTQAPDGKPVDKNDGLRSTSRQSTPSERGRRNIRGPGKRSKTRTASCPPEVLCALVWLDGQAPYSMDSGEEGGDGMEPWDGHETTLGARITG